MVHLRLLAQWRHTDEYASASVIVERVTSSYLEAIKVRSDDFQAFLWVYDETTCKHDHET